WPKYSAKGRKPSAQSTVEQDERKRDRADHVGRTHVIELDSARSCLAGEHAENKEHEQQWRAEPHCDQARQDAGEHEKRAEQNADADSVERCHNLILSPRATVHWHRAHDKCSAQCRDKSDGTKAQSQTRFAASRSVFVRSSASAGPALCLS